MEISIYFYSKEDLKISQEIQKFKNCVNLNEDIETTCLNCGFTEKVPDFIYDEMSRKKYHFKIKRRVSTLTCQNCGKNMAIPSSF